MSENWRAGKVEDVKLGKDGCVRQVTISYTDTTSDNAEDWTHRTVDRPVRNIVKISHINETSFMDDINEIHKLAVKLMNQENGEEDLDIKAENNVEAKPIDEPDDSSLDINLENLSNEEENDDPLDVKNSRLPESIHKKRKKRISELENLKIEMEGWNLSKSEFQAMPFTLNTTQLDKMVMNVQTDGGDKRSKEFSREGEEADADYDFNYVMNIDNFDELYLL